MKTKEPKLTPDELYDLREQQQDMERMDAEIMQDKEDCFREFFCGEGEI